MAMRASRARSIRSRAYAGGPTVPGFNTFLGDLTVINGNFNGGPGTSQLGVDAVFGGPGTNSASDLLVITNNSQLTLVPNPNSGAVTGSTGIIVANGNNPGQYNPVGIPVVAVFSGNTTAGNFFIDPQSNFYTTKGGVGVIDKGLFFYALDLIPSPNAGTTVDGVSIPSTDKDWVLLGLPNETAFQLAYATAGAQNIWYDTASTWVDRQDNLREQAACVTAPRPAPVVVTKAPPPAPCAPDSAWHYGAWIQGVGDWTRFSASQSVAGAGVGSTFTFDTSYHQNTYGFLGGVDMTQNSTYGLLQFGLLGGYVNSKLDFNSSTAPTSFHYTGGIVGATATYISTTGWFADALFKADLLTMNIDMPSIAAFGGTTASGVGVTNIGGMGDLGYRYSPTHTWFAETLGTLAYVSTHIDNATLEGTGVNWSNGQSFRGAIGERVGTTYVWWTQPVEASVTARIWNEFDANNSVALFTTGPTLSLTDSSLHNKPFGEVAGMLDFFNHGVGWSGFVNGGAWFNNDFTTFYSKVGLRYQW